MKRYLIAAVLLLLLLPLSAQNLRTVKGLVSNESGHPVAGAVLTVDGAEGQFLSDRMGRFEFKVPFSCTKLVANKDGYPTATVDIQSSYTLVRLTPAVPVESATALPAVKPEAAASSPDTSRNEEAEAAPKPVRAGKLDKAGFHCSFDLSYLYSFSHGTITHTNIGEQSYGALHPLELSCSLGYRFNRTFTLFAGAGFLFNLLDPSEKDSIDYKTYGDRSSLRRWDIPVFIGLKTSFTDAGVRPYILVQGGIHAMSVAPLAELGVGISVLTGGSTSLNLLLSARTADWPKYSATAFRGYPFTVAPSVKLGFSF